MSRFDLGLLVSYRPLAINSALASVRLLLLLRFCSSCRTALKAGVVDVCMNALHAVIILVIIIICIMIIIIII